MPCGQLRHYSHAESDGRTMTLLVALLLVLTAGLAVALIAATREPTG